MSKDIYHLSAFSFRLAAENLCHSHNTVWRHKQKKKLKTFVLDLGVISVVKGK